MASQWDRIFSWLKKNFTLNLFVAIVTVISAWFGCDQYIRNNGGKVKPVIYPPYLINSHYKDFLIVTTGDSIKIEYPRICPSYFNYSDFPIENINVNYAIKCPIDLKFAPILEPNDGFILRTQEFDSHNTFEWSIDYNKDILYSNETTPLPFKSISFFPNELKDSLFSYFDISSYIVFNGEKSEVFNSRINFIKIKDNIPIDIYNSPDSILSNSFFIWTSSVAKHLKDKVSGVSDILWAYHYKADSIKSYGAFSHLKNIGASDFDSLYIAPTSPFFLRSHLYQFKESTVEKSKIILSDTIIGILLFCIALLLVVVVIRNWRTVRKVFLISIILLLCSLASILFNSVFIYFDLYNKYYKIIICIIGILSSLYPIIIGIIKTLKQHNKDASDWILAASLLTMLVCINYLLVIEILNSLSI